MRRLLIALVALLMAALPAPGSRAMWGQDMFLTSGGALPPPPPSGCGTAPTQAQNAGFTTTALCADFSQASYATQSNWLDCNDSNDSLIWHSGTPGFSYSSQVACDINQVTDASISKAVMHLRYLPSYGTNNVSINPMGMETKNEVSGHISFGAVNMYVEETARILATNSDAGTYGTNEQLDGASGLYTWNNGSSGGSYEIDVLELYADRNGYSDAGIGNHGVAGGGFLFTSYSPQNTNVPSGYSVTAYHRYGALVTSDGSTHTYVCEFIDDVLQLCKDLNLSSGDTSMYHTPQWLVVGMENHWILPSVQYDLYVQNVKVWTCAALSPCNASTLFNSGGLTYWH